MRNRCYDINKNGLTPVTASFSAPAIPETFSLSRIGYLSVIAIVIAVISIAASSGIAWVIAVFSTAINRATDGGYILLPVVGALLLTALLRYASPFFNALGLTLAITTGAPLGAESPAMWWNSALGVWIGQRLRCNEGEIYTLYVAGICATLTFLFGAPVAAVFIALELLLPEWTLAGILPVATAVATAFVGYYIVWGPASLYNIPEGTAVGLTDMPIYLSIGLLIGLMGALAIKLSSIMEKWFGKLPIKNRWYLLLVPLMVGLAGNRFPQINSAGAAYVDDLLHAQVTLYLLFTLGIIKFLVWLCFSSAYKTGTGITPLLITGGAMSLLVGVTIQLLFPHVIINASMIVLAGMVAMLAGTSRALLAAICLAIEITHGVSAWMPLCTAGITAYGISLLLIKRQQLHRKAVITIK
ncbi:chloride channel protein [Chitinophaga sp. 30R24]|uniref:chloride channel protein n=1 Tax=Chitinophaga sp. 30R24 TaxID=3248838 RepID=UPI003B905620